MTDSKKRLRILFFTPWYPTQTNPVAGIFVHELCKSVAIDHYVRVIALSLDDYTRPSQIKLIEEIFDDLPVSRVTQGRGSFPRIRYFNRLFSQVWLLKKMIAEIRPDVIHATTYHAAIPAVLAARESFVPVIVTEHYSGFYRGMVTGVEKIKARWGLGHADRVISISSYLEGLLKAHGVKARYETVPIGIDTSLFNLTDAQTTPKKVPEGIMVGTLTPIKGYTYLLDALAILNKRGVNVLIHVAGDGELREMLEKKSRELGIESMIKFHGVLRKPDLALLMKRVDFAVTSSLGETFGVAIAEGLAVGLPTLATNVGAIPELIDETRGILVKHADGEALANGLVAMVEKVGDFDRRAISIWASERMAHEAVASQFVKICRDLID